METRLDYIYYKQCPEIVLRDETAIFYDGNRVRVIFSFDKTEIILYDEMMEEWNALREAEITQRFYPKRISVQDRWFGQKDKPFHDNAIILEYKEISPVLLKQLIVYIFEEIYDIF